MTTRDIFMMLAGGGIVAAILWTFNAIALELSRAEAVHLARLARMEARRHRNDP